MENTSLSRLLHNRYAQIASVVLIVQAFLFYTASHGEQVPLAKPLDQFPRQVEQWKLAQEGVVDEETRDVLKADDLLSRWYTDDGRRGANLFVAYFKTQRSGQSPHSPKNCLPGSGWSPSSTGFADVPIPSRNETIRINRYVVSKGDSKSVVLYWYQSQRRVVADEFSAKFYLVADSIKNHRSDTALVRIVVPVTNDQEQQALDAGISFAQVIYPALRGYFPT